MNFSNQDFSDLHFKSFKIPRGMKLEEIHASYEQLLETVAPVERVGIVQVIHDILEYALNKRLPKGVEFGISLLYVFYDQWIDKAEQFIPILSEFLLLDFHYDHEDLARLFQNMKSPETVDVLFETALKDEQHYYEYLDVYAGECYPLAVKCIYALRDIGTKKAREKLVLLTQSSADHIREKAERQIMRLDGIIMN